MMIIASRHLPMQVHSGRREQQLRESPDCLGIVRCRVYFRRFEHQCPGAFGRRVRAVQPQLETRTVIERPAAGIDAGRVIESRALVFSNAAGLQGARDFIR